MSDTNGNAYHAAAGPIGWRGEVWLARTWYATGIQSGLATVTAAFATPLSGSGLLYIHEYSGIDTATPVDSSASVSGGSRPLDSGSLQTTNAADLMVGGAASNNTAHRTAAATVPARRPSAT